MRFKVIRKAVENVVDKSLVGKIARLRSQKLEPPRPLAVIREQAMHVGAGHASIHRDGAVELSV